MAPPAGTRSVAGLFPGCAGPNPRRPSAGSGLAAGPVVRGLLPPPPIGALPASGAGVPVPPAGLPQWRTRRPACPADHPGVAGVACWLPFKRWFASRLARRAAARAARCHLRVPALWFGISTLSLASASCSRSGSGPRPLRRSVRLKPGEGAALPSPSRALRCSPRLERGPAAACAKALAARCWRVGALAATAPTLPQWWGFAAHCPATVCCEARVWCGRSLPLRGGLGRSCWLLCSRSAQLGGARPPVRVPARVPRSPKLQALPLRGPLSRRWAFLVSLERLALNGRALPGADPRPAAVPAHTPSGARGRLRARPGRLPRVSGAPTPVPPRRCRRPGGMAAVHAITRAPVGRAAPAPQAVARSKAVPGPCAPANLQPGTVRVRSSHNARGASRHARWSAAPPMRKPRLALTLVGCTARASARLAQRCASGPRPANGAWVSLGAAASRRGRRARPGVVP